MSNASAPPRPITVQFTVTLTAILRPDPDAGGFTASVPALPGCFTEGDTLDEVMANLKEATDSWLGSVHDEAVRRDAP